MLLSEHVVSKPDRRVYKAARHKGAGLTAGVIRLLSASFVIKSNVRNGLGMIAHTAFGSYVSCYQADTLFASSLVLPHALHDVWGVASDTSLGFRNVESSINTCFKHIVKTHWLLRCMFALGCQVALQLEMAPKRQAEQAFNV